MARGAGRRVVYLFVIVFVVLAVLFAVSWSEARAAFLGLAAAAATLSWWLTRRLPRGRASVWELRVEAGISLVVGVLLALAVPTTRIFCECPAARAVRRGFACGCASLDRHVALRVGIALGGLVLAGVLAMLARRRADVRRRLLRGETP
jgi:hypothetical protein